MNEETRTIDARPEGQPGFALAAAVMAMVLIGALVTGGFYVATQEGGAARGVRHGAEALNIAEHGVNQVVGTWPLGRFTSIPLGDTENETLAVDLGGRSIGEAEVSVRRLSDRTFLVTSNGRLLGRGRHDVARRTVAMFVRTAFFDLDSDQALMVYGPLHIGAASKVSGIDEIPAGWDESECPPLSDKPGVVARDESLVTLQGRAVRDGIHGEPPIVERPDMDESAFSQFGDWDYSALTAQADRVIPANSGPINNTAPSLRADGSCDITNPNNWGAPKNASHPCHDYFPIIHAKGDLHLNSQASGQGILLVDGDLHMNGGYEFTGIIIVQGKLINGGGNSKIYGTTLVYTEGDLSEQSVLTGQPLVNYSSCAVERTMRNVRKLSRAVPVSERSWFDLSAVGAGS